MLRFVFVSETQIGLAFNKGRFRRVLGAGRHLIGRGEVELIDVTKPAFEHAMFDVLITKPDVRARLEVIELTDDQRAVVYRDGRLFTILGAGRYAFWNVLSKITFEVFDGRAGRFAHPKLQAILQMPVVSKFLEGVVVPDHETVVLYRDGKREGVLEPGTHLFWKGTGKVSWKALDMREQVADVAGQEIMSQDKVSLRVNLIVTYAMVDAIKAIEASADPTQALYREAQLALRSAVGGRSLDALLADKDAVCVEVREMLARRSAELGIAVRGVGLKDIILPGDMRTLFNQVVAATKESEANLIRRREETAAARSQANTARLLAENPVLARLKELEMLKDVLAGTSATFVFGQGELTDQIKSLVGANPKT